MAALMAWWRQRSRKAKIALIIGAVLAGLIILGALLPSEETGDSGSANPPAAAPPTETEDEDEEAAETETETEPEPEPEAPPAPASNRAEDDYVPHVGPNRSVIVDTLEWRVLGARRAAELGSEFSRETPDGVFVVVALRVKNGKDESVTLNADQVTYEVGGKEYSNDSEGTIALSLEGNEETFFLKDLGPDVSTRGSVAFDVPPGTVGQKPEVCFGELGLGSTKGCIRLRFG